MSDVDLTTVYDLIIGDDAFDPEGSNNYKIGLTVDEFMIWDGAFTRNDLNDLVEYYGREPSVADENTVVDVFEKEEQPDVYFGFDGNWDEGGKNPSKLTEVGTSTFVPGFDGTENGAIYFQNGTNYATLDEFKLGTDSFSFSFWLNLQDITNGATAGDRWVFGLLSTSDGTGRENWGMNNCLFCYCPLYALGDKCGGSFTYLENGIKDCSSCLKPHRAGNYEKIMEKMGMVLELAKKQPEKP